MIIRRCLLLDRIDRSSRERNLRFLSLGPFLPSAAQLATHKENTGVYPAAPGARRSVKVESYEEALSRTIAKHRLPISQKCRRGDVEERGKRADMGLARLAFPVDDIGSNASRAEDRQ